MKIKEFHGFAYTRAAAADNFIHISTGLLSDMHGCENFFRARAVCTRRTKFMDFPLEMASERRFKATFSRFKATVSAFKTTLSHFETMFPRKT